MKLHVVAIVFVVAALSPTDYKGPPKHCGILETTYSKIDDAVCTEQGIGYICELSSEKHF